MNRHTRLLVAVGVGIVLAQSSGVFAKPAKPPGGGGSTATPDIVYMSDDSSTEALWQGGIRGVALTADGSSGTDISLQRPKAGRYPGAIVWSPDGQRAAWFNMGLGMVSTPVSIMVGAPTGKGAVVYTSVSGNGQPQINYGVDTLAWARDCTNPAESTLVFSAHAPDGLFAIRFVDGQASAPVQIFNLVMPNEGSWISPSALAFSPAGCHLVFAGSGPTGLYGVWLLDMRAPTLAPQLLMTSSQIAGRGFAPVQSVDWSRQGDRLALSVTTGNPTEWRDLKIAELGYLFEGGTEQVTGLVGVWTVALDGVFTAASSEHSPQWGPSSPGAACQRIAFSQSSDVASRSLYLLDVNYGGVGGCDIDVPLKLPAKDPRALDWK